MKDTVKVLNISRIVPIDGFPIENDIVLNTYAKLASDFNIKSITIKPIVSIPTWATWIKTSLKIRKEIIKNTTINKKYPDLNIYFYEYIGLLLKRLPISNTTKVPVSFFFSKNRLLKLVEEFRPDCTHAHYLFPDGYFAYKVFKKFGIPYIITLRGDVNRLRLNSIKKKILSAASCISTPSIEFFEYFKSSDYNVQLIPHGIDEFWYLNENKAEIKDLRLVSVCRLQEWKNVQIVLEAISLVKSKLGQVTYTIIGDGIYRRNLEELVIKLGLSNCVRFTGWLGRSEIRKIYKECNVFILLSRPETFGRAFFEAAAQGLAIIGAKNTGAFGHLTPDEAIFVDESNTEEVTKVLLDLNQDKILKLSTKSLKKLEYFREDKILNVYNQFIRKAIIGNH